MHSGSKEGSCCVSKFWASFVSAFVWCLNYVWMCLCVHVWTCTCAVVNHLTLKPLCVCVCVWACMCGCAHVLWWTTWHWNHCVCVCVRMHVCVLVYVCVCVCCHEQLTIETISLGWLSFSWNGLYWFSWNTLNEEKPQWKPWRALLY